MSDVGAPVGTVDSYEAIPFREVLDQRLVLEYVGRLRECIEDHLQTDPGPMEYEGDVATQDDLVELLETLDAIALEFGGGLGAESVRGWLAKSFFPRNRDLAFIQERLTECATKFVARRRDSVGTDAASSPPEELEAPLPAVAGASFPRRSDPRLELFEPFEPCDPRWAICLWNKVRKHPKHPFNSEPARAQLGDSARLVILGDWASGVPRALALGRAIAKQLDDEGGARDTHVVHLGDTYYVGSREEQQEHVLDAWPRPSDVEIRSWAVPGNHDYYSGGHGFFTTLLADPRFGEQRSPDGEPTSIFDLSNERWRVLGLDTAWKDHDLVDEEWAWLEQTLHDAGGLRQQVILLSHHQPHSAFTDPNRDFADRVLELLGRCPVHAWFWGHEHRCTIYEPIAGVARPRCVGNGGVPEWVDTTTRPGVIADCEEIYRDPEDGEAWRQFAYAIVDLDGGGFAARYVTETGAMWHAET